MDVNKISKVRPVAAPGGDAGQSAGRAGQQRTSSTGSQSAGGTEASSGSSGSASPQSSATSEATADGVLGSANVETGQTRDAADRRQTRDRAPDAADISSRLRERFSALAEEARLPTNTRLSIDFDSETNEARFRVVNKDTGDVIREIPEPEFVDLLRRVERQSGLVDDEF